MTKETAIRLYKHYKEIGYTKALNDIISKHPWLIEEDKPIKETKSKGKK